MSNSDCAAICLHICVLQSVMHCEPHIICSVNQHGFSAVHYDWLLYFNLSNLKYSGHSSYTFCVHLKMFMCVQFSLSRAINDWTQDQHGYYFKFSCKKYSPLSSRKGDIMNTVDTTESNVFWCYHFEVVYER